MIYSVICSHSPQCHSLLNSCFLVFVKWSCTIISYTALLRFFRQVSKDSKLTHTTFVLHTYIYYIRFVKKQKLGRNLCFEFQILRSKHFTFFWRKLFVERTEKNTVCVSWLHFAHLLPCYFRQYLKPLTLHYVSLLLYFFVGVLKVSVLMSLKFSPEPTMPSQLRAQAYHVGQCEDCLEWTFLSDFFCTDFSRAASIKPTYTVIVRMETVHYKTCENTVYDAHQTHLLWSRNIYTRTLGATRKSTRAAFT